MKINFTILLAFIFISSMSAQVVINEYSASNLTKYVDQFDKTEDWIELYNTTNTAVDLSGWHLSDKASKPEKWMIPEGVVIEAGDYLVFLCSGRDKVFKSNPSSPAEYHTNFKLSQTKGGETLILSDPSGEVLQSIPYETTMIESDVIETFQTGELRNIIELIETSRIRITDGADQWMLTTEPTFNQSNNGSAVYAGYTDAPTIELEAGFYEGTQMVTITNNEPNSVLRYTTDATNVKEDSPEYTEAIEVTENTVIKARAYSNDAQVLPGKMDFSTIFIDEDITLPVFSIAADGIQLLANDRRDVLGSENEANNTRTFKPVGSLEYFDASGERQAASFGDLNRHGQDSWALDHRSIDWVSRDEMGYSKSIDTKLFEYSDRDEYQRIILRASGDDNYPARQNGSLGGSHIGSTHVRDEFVHQIAQDGGMKVDVRAVERVVVFLNGEYWGVYGLRERPVDHDYVEEYYGHDKPEVQFLSTWAQTEAEYGGYQALYDWMQFREFILNNDMGVEENYQYVKDNFQVQSLIDYMAVNLNTVAKDWLNYNTGWWRGLNPDGSHKKWGYIIWDMDATYGYYINYTGVPNETATAEACDIDDIAEYVDDFFTGWGGGWGGGFEYTDPVGCSTIGTSSPYDSSDKLFNWVIQQDESCCESNWGSSCQDMYDFVSEYGTNTSEFLSVNGNIGSHEIIFLKLQEESDEFRQLYYSRQADLINTVYSCENMLTTLESMVAEIRPEMPRQIARWGGSMEEWEGNVERLTQFVQDRCELIGEGMECFDSITTSYDLTLNTSPEGVGEIDLNTLDIRDMPWTGKYFDGMDNIIKARAFDEDEWYFSHWETTNGTPVADSTDFKSTIRLTQDEELIAVFSSEPVSTFETESGHTFKVFPNPASDYLVLNYELAQSSDIKVTIYNTLGSKVADVSSINGRRTAGQHTEKINLDGLAITSGMHLVEVNANNEKAIFRVMIAK